MKKYNFNAFTLAEMMVVMLILSIIMAAFAPVMTTRSKVDLSSPWKYAPNNSDIYYGLGNRQTAMIGQRSIKEDDPLGRLLINTSSDAYSHIVFKQGNTLLGKLFLNDNNLFLGRVNNTDEITGNYNVGIGKVMDSLTSGEGNVAIGFESMSTLQNGKGNTAIGYQALHSDIKGTGNTAIGYQSLYSNVGAAEGWLIGNYNTALGYKTLRNNTTGQGNTAFGNNALANNTVGCTNTAIGQRALEKNENGSTNIAIGGYALYENVKGDGNIALGSFALMENKKSENIGIGSKALTENVEGANNVAVGESSLSTNINGSDNVALGSKALRNNKNSNQVAIGAGALENHNSTTARENVAIGYNALNKSQASGNDTAVGAQAMGRATSTTGPLVDDMYGSNTAIGYNALNRNTFTGNYSYTIGQRYPLQGSINTAVGKDALASNTTGMANTAVGAHALETNTSSVGNTAVGAYAIPRATGQYNTAIGYYSAPNITSGYHNIAIGAGSLEDNTTGYNNIAIGLNACQHVTGSNKVCIGNDSGPNDGTQRADRTTESLYFGTPGHFTSGSTDINTNGILELHKRGNYAVAFLNADLVVNGFTWTQVGGKSGHGDAIGFLRSKTWKNEVALYNEARPGFPPASPFSDRRLKFVGKEFTSGLDKISQIKIFNFTFKKDPKKVKHVGVIAQDLEKIFPDAVTKDEETGYLTIRWEDMFYALINSVKELDAKVTYLIKQENAKDKKIKELESRLDALEKKLK